MTGPKSHQNKKGTHTPIKKILQKTKKATIPTRLREQGGKDVAADYEVIFFFLFVLL
jgi:hypothetical protein